MLGGICQKYKEAKGGWKNLAVDVLLYCLLAQTVSFGSGY